METREDKGERLFLQGYNCAQSTFAALADYYGIDETLALKLAASFGAGFGRMRGVCGVVSAMALVAGLETGAVEGADKEGKGRNYAIVQELANQFIKENGTMICSELLGLSANERKRETAMPSARTEQYYKKRPCPGLVRCGIRICCKWFDIPVQAGTRKEMGEHEQK